MNDVKLKVSRLVEGYIKMFPQEFEGFKVGIRQKRDKQVDKFGSFKKTDYLQRALYEIPETLDTIFRGVLNEDEREWLRTMKAARWFTKTFKEFSLIEKV